MLKRRLLPCAVIVALLPHALTAATLYWDGMTDNRLTEGTNWNPDQSLTGPSYDLTGHTLIVNNNTSFGGGTNVSVNENTGTLDRLWFDNLSFDVNTVVFGNSSDGDLLDNFGGVLTFNAGGGLKNAQYRSRGASIIQNNSGADISLEGDGALFGLGATYDSIQFSGNGTVISGTRYTASNLEELIVAVNSNDTVSWQATGAINSATLTLISGTFSLETADAIDDATNIAFDGPGTLALLANDAVGALELNASVATLDIGDSTVSFASASGTGSLDIVNFSGNGSQVYFADASGLDSGFSALSAGESLELSNVSLNGGLAYLTKLSGTQGLISAVAQDGMVVVGYVPPYRLLNTPVSHYQYLTHAIYHGFSADPNNAGALQLAWENGSWPVLTTYQDRLDAIKATYPQIKLIMGLLGSSSGYGPATTNATVRATFIQNLINYCQANGYDGVNFDWEYPDNGSNGPEQVQYSALLVETAAAFASAGLEVSVADGQWGYHLSQAAYDAVDYVHYMGYDNNYATDGPHSDYTDMIGGLLNLMAKGAPREKLTLGMPFFARSYAAAGRQNYIYSYLQQTYGPLDPDADELINSEDHFTYDGITTISNKSSYAKDNGFAGVMIWELSQDTWTAADQSLLINGIYPVKQASSSDAPYTILAYENFEGSSSIFTAGGADAMIPATARALSGSQSAMIQDNSGKRSAIDVTVDLTGYQEVVFDFCFNGKGIDWLEAFYLEVNTGGNNWSIIAMFEQGIPNINGFPNGPWMHAVMGFDNSSFGFSSSTKFRFRCDASADDDQIFIDDVTIRAR